MAEDEKPQAVEGIDDGVAIPPKKTSNKTVIIVVAVVVFIFVILPTILFMVFAIWLGSGNNAEKLTEQAIESTTGADVDLNTRDGNYSIKNDNGDEFSVGSNQNYADDFPASVPKYPGGKVSSNIRSERDGTKYWSNTVTTEDDSQKVINFFSSEMTGWEETSTFTANNATTVTYKLGQIETMLTIAKSTQSNGSTIIYSVTEKTN